MQEVGGSIYVRHRVVAAALGLDFPKVGQLGQYVSTGRCGEWFHFDTTTVLVVRREQVDDIVLHVHQIASGGGGGRKGSQIKILRQGL